MPLQSIIVVILRLLVIQQFFAGLIYWGVIWMVPLKYSVSTLICWFAIGALVWIFSSQLARLIARGYDATVSLSVLTRQDLYCFAFVFVGLGLFLNGVVGFPNAISRLIAKAPVSPIAFLLSDLAEIILGLFTLLFANRWAKKLVSREE